MGYGTSKKTIQKVQLFLDQMVAADENIVWTDKEPNKLAYKLHAGIYVARHFFAFDENKKSIEPYHTYAHLEEKYIIRVGSGTVTAELRIAIPILATQTIGMRFDGLSSMLQVVGAVIKHKAPEMYFPSADLTPDEIIRIYTWASKNEYYIIKGDGITITRKDPGELAWKPSP